MLRKSYSKTGRFCRVTFELPAEVSATKVCLSGEFNDWSCTASPMKQLRDGSFSVALDLATDREYQFRYLIDGERWENDWVADKYVPSPFGDCENSVVAT